jgi:hypothetical protein
MSEVDDMGRSALIALQSAHSDIERGTFPRHADPPATRGDANRTSLAGRMVQRTPPTHDAPGPNAARGVLPLVPRPSPAAHRTASALAARLTLRASAGTRSRTAGRSVRARRPIPRPPTPFADRQPATGSLGHQPKWIPAALDGARQTNILSFLAVGLAPNWRLDPVPRPIWVLIRGLNRSSRRTKRRTKVGGPTRRDSSKSRKNRLKGRKSLQETTERQPYYSNEQRGSAWSRRWRGPIEEPRTRCVRGHGVPTR